MKKYVIPAAGAAVAVTALVVFVALRPGAEAPEGTPVEAPEPAPVTEDEEPGVTDEDAESDRVAPAGPTVKAVPESEIRGARKPKDAKLSAFVDPQAKGTRIPGDITSRIPRIDNPEDVPLVVSVMKDRKDTDTVRHEAVNLLRRSGYPELTRDLIRVLDDSREGARFRAFCTQHLWCNYEKARPEEQAVIEAKLRELLRDDERAVRREALLALVRLRDPLGEKAAVEWLHDDERTKVRDLAIRCVRELGLKEHLPRVREIARDEDETETARAAAIFTLSQWEDRESLPAIREAARSKSLRVQKAARVAIRRLEEAKQGQ